MSKRPEPAALAPGAEKALKRFYLDAAECMSLTGRALLTLTELRAWQAQGRPTDPTEHVYDSGLCLLCRASESGHYDNAWCPRGKSVAA